MKELKIYNVKGCGDSYNEWVTTSKRVKKVTTFDYI